MPPDEPSGLYDEVAGEWIVRPTQKGPLPGLDDEIASEPTVAEPSVPEPTVAEPSVPEPTVAEPSVPATGGSGQSNWTEQELDDWFENDFGGADWVPHFENQPVGNYTDEFKEAVWAYRNLGPDDAFLPGIEDAKPPWDVLSIEMKAQLRRGWEGMKAVVGDPVADELTPLPPIGAEPPDWTGPVEDATSPGPTSFKWLVLGVALVIGALLTGALVLIGNQSNSGLAVTTATTPTLPTTSGTVISTTTTATTTTTTVPELIPTTTLAIAIPSPTITTTTAPAVSSKSYSVQMPCPAASGSKQVMVHVYIAAGAINPTHSLPDPNNCPDTTTTTSSSFTSGSPEPGRDTYTVTFIMHGGPGATGASGTTDPVTVKVTWTNP